MQHIKVTENEIEFTAEIQSFHDIFSSACVIFNFVRCCPRGTLGNAVTKKIDEGKMIKFRLNCAKEKIVYDVFLLKWQIFIIILLLSFLHLQSSSFTILSTKNSHWRNIFDKLFDSWNFYIFLFIFILLNLISVCYLNPKKIHSWKIVFKVKVNWVRSVWVYLTFLQTLKYVMNVHFVFKYFFD